MFKWIFGSLNPRCMQCEKPLKENWVEAFGETFCSKDCSSKFGETDEFARGFKDRAKAVLEFRKKAGINKPGAIPQTREGEGGDTAK
ncbi:MAG: hypothetical protein HZB68_02500 [Candidatus Aenigmarchaeota archaeon]|nr:hypothetical protein [Candidatus Aenigmarchaeota archaeon]